MDQNLDELETYLYTVRMYCAVNTLFLYHYEITDECVEVVLWFIDTFKILPQHVSASDYHQGIVVLQKLLKQFCVVAVRVYGLQLLKCGQLSRDATKSLVTWCTHHVTRHNTPIHNILSTAPQLSISQKALGTLPGDGNVMPKHVGANIHN
jgi:hypothetical protein